MANTSYTYTLADSISAFRTIALSGQDPATAIGNDVIADTQTDTLILSE